MVRYMHLIIDIIDKNNIMLSCVIDDLGDDIG